MGKSSELRLDDFRAIHRLIAECRDQGDDAMQWRAHWAAGLAFLTDSDLVHTGEMGGCRSLQPRDLGVAYWGWQTGAVDPTVIERHMSEFRGDPNYSPAMITHLERHTQRDGVCHVRTHLVEDRPWYRSPDYNVIQASVNVDHIMWCFRTIPGTNDESTGMVLNRQKGRRDYTLREVAIIQEANTALTPLIGGALARFSDPSPYALAPRARDVLACMLEGDSDKQIAQRLTISSYTVNQYAKLIYTHFHVNSRAQLLAQWIRRNRGSQFPWAN